ncbi:MAG TPA: transposase, partial [Dermatophilaceae bacterium]
KIEGTPDGQARLFLPKIGWVPFVLSRPLPSDPTSVTVIREADGRTYLSFVVTVIDTPKLTAARVCGIDPGLSTFATILSVDTHTGAETQARIDTPKFLRRKARALARSQRSLSRKKKGSRNRAKAKVRVAVLHRKVRETRLDHAHQQAAEIVAAHDIIAIETLSVAGMGPHQPGKIRSRPGDGPVLAVDRRKGPPTRPDRHQGGPVLPLHPNLLHLPGRHRPERPSWARGPSLDLHRPRRHP